MYDMAFIQPNQKERFLSRLKKEEEKKRMHKWKRNRRRKSSFPCPISDLFDVYSHLI